MLMIMAPRQSQTWAQWTAANGLGELIGLGGAFAFGLFIGKMLGEPTTVPIALAYLTAVVLIAILEGAAVATAQWIVLSRTLAVSQRAWTKATLTGTLIAWLLGVVPSSLATYQQRSGVPLPEPSQTTVILFTAIMGAVLGAVLALPQALVLRRVVEHPFRWIPANVIAWAIGMPLVFSLVGVTIARSRSLDAVVILICRIGLIGAVVGGIHGLWLVTFVRRESDDVPGRRDRAVAA
jgi:hypothetical protein